MKRRRLGALPNGRTALGRLEGDFRPVTHAALGLVTTEDLEAALAMLPGRLKRLVLQQVNVSASKVIPSAALTQLFRLLRGGDPGRSQTVIGVFTDPIRRAFGNPDDLDETMAIALLSSGDCSNAPYFACFLSCPIPLSIRRWALALVVEDRAAPLAPVALGFLHAEADLFGAEHAELIRSAWAGLRGAHPRLPRAPISSTALIAALKEEPLMPAVEQEEEREPVVTVPETGAEVAVADLAAETRSSLSAAVGAARRVVAALEAETPPGRDDLGCIEQIAVLFDELAATFPEVERGLAAYERAADERKNWKRNAERVAALTRLQGPDQCEELLAEVRAAAGRGVSDDLLLLADLLDAVREGREDDEEDLADRAETQWPESWIRLIRWAVKGRLSLAPVVDVAVPALPAAGDTEPEPARSKAPPREPERSHDGEPAAEATSIPGAAAATEEGPSIVHEIFADLAGMTASARDTEPEPGGSEPGGSEPGGPESSTAGKARGGHEPGQVEDDPGPSRDEAAERLPVSEPPPEISRAEAIAMQHGRLGLAAWIRLANGRPQEEVDARRSAAIADEVIAMYGDHSPGAEFRARVQGLSSKALKDDRGGQLMAWAACIRAGLVAPSHESTEALDELAPVVSGFPGLAGMGRAFMEAAQQGAYLEPELSSRMRGSTQAEQHRADAARRARQMLSEGARRQINYAQATVVWKMMLSRNGRIGVLLEQVAEDQEPRLSEVSETLKELHSHGAVDRLIDEITRQSSMSTKSKIIATARRKLVGLVEEALGIAGEWVEAVREAQTAPVGKSWAADRLEELRSQLAPLRKTSAIELDELTAETSSLAPAASVARRLLDRTLALLDGSLISECGTGLPVHHLLNHDLVLVRGLRVEPSDFSAPVPAVADLCAVALAGEPDWEAAFRARAEVGDHEGTQILVGIVERIDRPRGVRLRTDRERLVNEARQQRGRRTERIRDEVARWLRDGLLLETDSAETEQTLRGLEHASRVDFDRTDAALDQLEEDLARRRANSIEAARVEFAERLGESRGRALGNRTTDRNTDRITERIEAGDLTTAREFMTQLEENGSLPEPQEHDGHFARFFPVFPKAFAQMVARATGSRARKHDSDEIISGILDAVKSGREVTDSALAALLGDAGIDITGLRGGRRREASECLRMWRSLSQGQRDAGNFATPIDAILRTVGVEGRQSPGERLSQRAWVELDDVRLIGDPLLPAFGSKKSPSGRSLRLLLVWGRPGPKQLLEFVKNEPKDRTVLVFYFGVLDDTLRTQLAEASRKHSGPVTAVIDEAAISYLALMPEADWSVAVSLLAPFTVTNPFAPTGGVPDEMFMGRQRQLQAVMKSSGSSFVYGGRQFGKSALLRKAESEVRRTDSNRVVIFETIQLIGKSSPADALWQRLGPALAKSGVISGSAAGRDDVCTGIRDWTEADHDRQLLLLLDEADWFLNNDADQHGFENVTALRDLMNNTGGRVKVVFAGLHQTTRFERLPNQPMNSHMGEPIAVGPLESQAAFDLLVGPLGTLGFVFEEHLAARIIAEANNAPALVQLFAAALLDRLNRLYTGDRPIPYVITRADVDAIWRDSGFRKGITDRFEWTLNLDKRYKVIAYSVALKALESPQDPTVGRKELQEMCRGWWERGFGTCGDDEFSGLLSECVNLGVLVVEDDNRYRLRTPHILHLLGGSAEVEAELVKAESYEMPDAFDAGAHRSPLGQGQKRSPLTGDQLAMLTQEWSYATVVSGSEALGQQSVVKALTEEFSRHPQCRVLTVGRDQHQLTFEGAIEQARRSPTRSMVVVDLSRARNRSTVPARIADASRAVRTSARGTLAIVLVVSPEAAALWTGLPEPEPVRLLELRRLTEAGIRQWIHDDSSGLQGTDASALLKITGGWPSLLDFLTTRPGPVGSEMEHAHAICQAHLTGSARPFVRSTGVEADPVLKAAWTFLTKHQLREPAEELAEFLGIAGADHPELLSGPMKAKDYRNYAQVIETLRVLGVLQKVADSERVVLECEPVLAGAWRQVYGG